MIAGRSQPAANRTAAQTISRAILARRASRVRRMSRVHGEMITVLAAGMVQRVRTVEVDADCTPALVVPVAAVRMASASGR